MPVNRVVELVAVAVGVHRDMVGAGKCAGYICRELL